MNQPANDAGQANNNPDGNVDQINANNNANPVVIQLDGNNPNVGNGVQANANAGNVYNVVHQPNQEFTYFSKIKQMNPMLVSENRECTEMDILKYLNEVETVIKQKNFLSRAQAYKLIEDGIQKRHREYQNDDVATRMIISFNGANSMSEDTTVYIKGNVTQQGNGNIQTLNEADFNVRVNNLVAEVREIFEDYLNHLTADDFEMQVELFLKKKGSALRCYPKLYFNTILEAMRSFEQTAVRVDVNEKCRLLKKLCKRGDMTLPEQIMDFEMNQHLNNFEQAVNNAPGDNFDQCVQQILISMNLLEEVRKFKMTRLSNQGVAVDTKTCMVHYFDHGKKIFAKNQQEQVPMGAVMVMATPEKMENQNNEAKSTKNTKTILPFDQIPKTCKDAFDAHEDMHGDHHFKECQFKSSLFYHKKANKRKNEQGEPSPHKKKKGNNKFHPNYQMGSPLQYPGWMVPPQMASPVYPNHFMMGHQGMYGSPVMYGNNPTQYRQAPQEYFPNDSVKQNNSGQQSEESPITASMANNMSQQ